MFSSRLEFHGSHTLHDLYPASRASSLLLNSTRLCGAIFCAHSQFTRWKILERLLPMYLPVGLPGFATTEVPHKRNSPLRPLVHALCFATTEVPHKPFAFSRASRWSLTNRSA